MIAWVVALAWAECGEVALATLTRDMDEALGAFASLDEAAFVGAAARAEAELPCLVEVIDHEAAAEWHVLQAVRAWYADPEHPELARLHLSAAATSGLSASDFADVLVAGSPLGDLRAEALAGALPIAAWPGPLTLRTGGYADRGPADGLPALAQLARGERALWTRAWVEAPPLRPPRPALTAATAALGAATAASLGVAIGTRAAWADVEGRTPGLRVANHVAVGASAGFGAAFTGLGVAAIVDAVRARRAP